MSCSIKQNPPSSKWCCCSFRVKSLSKLTSIENFFLHYNHYFNRLYIIVNPFYFHSHYS